MPKKSIEFCKESVVSPLTFWVHKATDAEIWIDATTYSPPLPAPITGKGYIKYRLEYRGHTLFFGSKEEINHCMEILSKKVLPTTRTLAERAGYPAYQHLHWLSRWPGNIKSWKDRQIIVKNLRQLLEISENP